MTEEPTAVQLDEIEAGDDSPVMEYEDQLIKLVTGELLVTRVLKNIEDAKGVLMVYKPAQLIETADGDVILREWLPEADDDYLIIPMDRVLLITYPKDNIRNSYLSAIGNTDEVEELEGAPEGETIH